MAKETSTEGSCRLQVLDGSGKQSLFVGDQKYHKNDEVSGQQLAESRQAEDAQRRVAESDDKKDEKKEEKKERRSKTRPPKRRAENRNQPRRVLRSDDKKDEKKERRRKRRSSRDRRREEA